MLKIISLLILLCCGLVFAQNYRLPPSIHPTKYELWIKIDLDSGVFSGNVTIDMEVTASTNEIHLNSKDLNVAWSEAVIFNSVGTIQYTFLSGRERVGEQIYVMTLNTGMPVGFYTISLRYSGDIRNDLTGLYKSSYQFVDGAFSETRYVAATHLEPTYARQVFPCFDEPALKATFKINILNDQKYRSIGNMPQIDEPEIRPEENNYLLTQYAETPLMSTYLIAFAVTHEYAQYTEEPGLIRIHTSRHEINRTPNAYKYAVRSLESLENFLNHTYQLPKSDLLNIPDFLFGAMENWGLMIFKEPFLFRDNDVTLLPVRSIQSGALLITHEFVHMWFGNEVTPEFWTYIWMSEGFARFFEYYTTDQLEPSWRIMDQFVVSNVQSSFSQDDKETARAMTTEVADPIVINDMFDYILYAKSASVIRMIQNAIGLNVFQKALHEYISDHSYLTTQPDFLFFSLQHEVDVAHVQLPDTVKHIFESWSDNAGYPVVSVHRNYEASIVEFSQHRFLVGNTTNKEWPQQFIPVSYVTADSPVFTDTSPDLWLVPGSNAIHTLPENVSWILANKQVTGYYRVQYDLTNWKALTQALYRDNFDNINVLNRAQLIDDAVNLAKAGQLEFDVSLDLLMYLKNEIDYIPWATASPAINYFDRYLRGHEQYDKFEYFIRNISDLAFNSVRINPETTDHVQRLHRMNVGRWACQTGLPLCLEDVAAVVNRMVNENKAIMPEIRDFVLCSAAKYSDELTEDLIKYVVSKQPQLDEEVRAVITGLGCSRNQSVIQSYYELSIATSNQLAASDRNLIYRSYVSGSYEGTRLGLEFLKSNFPTIVERYDSVTNVFTSLGPYIVTSELRDLLAEIISIHSNAFEIAVLTVAQQALQEADRNLLWLSQHSSVIGDWLNEHIEMPDSASSILVNVTLLITMLIIVIFNSN